MLRCGEKIQCRGGAVKMKILWIQWLKKEAK
jgi:hypothetical protein